MTLNTTPSSHRIHIGFFGIRNAGKSSLVNQITGQDTAIVSPTKGTTTDPVHKAMELLPLGPVVLIDTAGIDEQGSLGQKRMQKTRQVLDKTDIAVIVMDGQIGPTPYDENLITLCQEKDIPHIRVYNKWDRSHPKKLSKDVCYVSAKTGHNIKNLKEKIIEIGKKKGPQRPLVKDLVEKNDMVVLVTPIDDSAPKGRLILPQQQTIRDLLEKEAITLVIQQNQLTHTLGGLKQKPKMVICDSQIFRKVDELTPKDIPLTSFSILFARYKGFLETAIQGAHTLDKLQDGDKILISEGCTHHRQCEDIGTIKLPGWIKQYTNKNIQFDFTSGQTFPEHLKDYRLVIHCGGCMLNQKQMLYRNQKAYMQDIPMTNYGICIAHINGILKRSTHLFNNKSPYRS